MSIKDKITCFALAIGVSLLVYGSWVSYYHFSFEFVYNDRIAQMIEESVKKECLR